MLWNVLGAAAVAGLVLLLAWTVRGLLLTPVRAGANTRVVVRLDVSGADATLESTLGALMWLDSNGTLSCDIEVCDMGMDEATRAVAEALAREGAIRLIEGD